MPCSSSAVVRSSSSVPSSSSLIQTGIIPGTPVDYDGETYETVVIGSQIWMARNLNYDVSGSKCYNDQESYCKTYGRLYDWNTAMAACPPDWHLPSNADWDKLFKYVGSSGRWWSSVEHDSYYSDAYIRIMIYTSENARWDYYDKSDLFSVCCLQD